MIDVKTEIDAVSRSVGTAGDARVSTMSRVYPTGIEDLWDAVTSAERIPRWFLPITGDLKEGGHYQLEGNAGGTITRCDRPHEFSATWEYGDTSSDLTVRLTAVDEEHTRLELVHSGVPDPDFWAQFGPGATGLGWDGGLLGLSLYLSAPDREVDKEAVAAWMGTDEGRDFWRRSSESWYAANVAAGTDPETARGMADRTFAAYTGG
ncbi:SRPBCC domain-containing protein [Actinoplanes sp. NPDC051633]|uniref:SRPBCC domain-containing protein n=1 Tax=Actinoplanes sp. NPDC051633 TaxID=3155670 RepID=UPI0034355F00